MKMTFGKLVAILIISSTIGGFIGFYASKAGRHSMAFYDDDGNKRISIKANPKTPAIFFYDEEGQPVASMALQKDNIFTISQGTDDDEYFSFGLLGNGEQTGVFFSNKSGNPNIFLGMTDENEKEGTLQLTSRDDKAKVLSGITSEVYPFLDLSLVDAGEIFMGVDPENGPVIRILKNGETLWQAP